MDDEWGAAQSLETLLSSKLWTGLSTPKLDTVDPELGFLTDLGQLLRDVFSAPPGKALIEALAVKAIPYFRRLGATHACTLRPNHDAQQSRISLMKIIWLSSDLGVEAAAKKIMDERALDSVLPESQSMMQWIEPFICQFPYHFAIPVNLLGGYVFFFAPGPWRFLREASLGLSGMFLHDPKTMATDDLIFQPIPLRKGDSKTGYDMVKMSVNAINTVSWFVTNPMNFSTAGKLDAQKQTLFLSALELLMGDVKGMAGSYSNFSKASFCFSALDKLANIAAGMADNPRAEASLFRKLFSVATARKLRAAATSAAQLSDPFTRRTLQMQLRAIVTAQRQIRRQLKTGHQEPERLRWLRSLRNLRHGAFLENDQFIRLFVDSPGEVPSEIVRATMALVLTMMLLPEDFFSVVQP